MEFELENIIATIKHIANIMNNDQTDEHDRQLARRTIRRISREIFPFTLPPHVALDTPTDTTGTKNVHLGCGQNILPGFLNIDLVSPADLIWDLRTTLPIRTASINLVFSEHFLEHIDFDFSAIHVIKEIYRILSANGEVIIAVPDAEKIVRAYTNDDKVTLNEYRNRWFSGRNLKSIYQHDFDLVSLVFHDEYSHKRYTPHFWGFSYESLKALLQQAGFQNAERLHEPPPYSNAKRHFGSLYVRAHKKSA